MEVLIFALILVALIFGVIEVSRSDFRGLLAWAVVLLAVALLIPRIPAF